jgi:hypothetical protein
MAHFTVKEYLSALPPDHSEYSRYSQAKSFVRPQLAITCLNYIILDCYNGSVIENFGTWSRQQKFEYPFRRHAVEYWVDYADDNWENTRILELAQQLLDPAATGCFLSWTRDFIFQCAAELMDDGKEDNFDTVTSHFCAGGLKPLHMAAALGLPEICRWLVASDCNVNERSNVGTPLHCTLLGIHRLWKSQVNSDWAKGLKPFQDFGEASRMLVLEILLSNGADCNALYRDRFGKDFPSSHLAFFSDIGRGAEHPLVKIVAAGARLEDRLLEYLVGLILSSISQFHSS